MYFPIFVSCLTLGVFPWIYIKSDVFIIIEIVYLKSHVYLVNASLQHFSSGHQ
uniref:Uncharacterized protein n=1 Tax=Rhizophagus irregularis (strain DAOM 181602 / DAOM 197198 / MUCL 43194) TaxID=747089 RepID=U9US83_RHIID